ncbi:flavin reductase [Coprobacillaceae bacterium CR2/5/TPMF4]|nr:flavin reductase [Coprobacillaceae bacterium CR2/5/TPMF4]
MLTVFLLEAPFSIFERFGFQSGRTADKFADFKPLHSDNGLAFLPRYINAFISLEVENYVDLGSHGMFICKVTEARVMSDKETMTYTYYQDHVKPKPNTEGKKDGYVKSVVISTKVTHYQMIIFAHFVNMVLLILNQLKIKYYSTY